MITYQAVKPKTSFTKSALADINSIFKQLDPNSPKITQKALADTASHSYLILAKAGDKIIGTGTLCILYTPKLKLGHLEQVVVDEQYRGQGIGRKISQLLIAQGKKLKLANLALTSNPKRLAANNLYKSLGFELWETNAYRMRL